jgi:hypothetical protein
MTVRHASRIWLVVAAMAVGVAGFAAGEAQGKGKKTAAAAADTPKHDVNACGCYKDTAGACFCGKKGKCACPGDCEPKGCEEKRQKQITKEVAVETKKAHDADKKQRTSHEHPAPKPSTPSKHKPDGVGQ